MTLEFRNAEFDARALQIYEDAKVQIGYYAYRFRQKVVQDGGVAAAKQWLRPKGKVTKGFVRLMDHDRLDLSVEAVVLNEPWRTLFTDEELATAHGRLEEYGYFASRPAVVDVVDSLPEELLHPELYPEGARRTITVSAYERDPRAREACVKHFGAICYVCGFNFEKKYGALGKGYIHVHHLRPFAPKDPQRRTNPVTDLRPVCPNCHGMLHRKNPPIPVGTLKKIVESEA